MTVFAIPCLVGGIVHRYSFIVKKPFSGFRRNKLNLRCSEAYKRTYFYCLFNKPEALFFEEKFSKKKKEQNLSQGQVNL